MRRTPVCSLGSLLASPIETFSILFSGNYGLMDKYMAMPMWDTLCVLTVRRKDFNRFPIELWLQPLGERTKCMYNCKLWMWHLGAAHGHLICMALHMKRGHETNGFIIWVSSLFVDFTFGNFKFIRIVILLIDLSWAQPWGRCWIQCQIGGWSTSTYKIKSKR